MKKQKDQSTIKSTLLRWVVLLPAIFFVHILYLAEKSILPLILNKNHSLASLQRILLPAFESIILNILLFALCLYLIFKKGNNPKKAALTVTTDQKKILKSLNDIEKKCLRKIYETSNMFYYDTNCSYKELKRLIDANILDRQAPSEFEEPNNINCKINRTVYEYLQQRPKILKM